MHYLTRTILIAVCLTVLSAVPFVSAQEKPSAKAYLCKNQFEVDYIGYERIRGPVESMNIERETLVSEGHTLFTNKGKPYVFATYKYDRGGRLIEKNFYRVDGVALPKSTFDYDTDGKLVKENYYSAISKKPYLDTNYIYENGFLKESIGRNIEDGGFLSKQVFTYDAERNYFEFIETYSYNSPALRVGFKQDEKCRFAEVFGYRADGRIAGKNVISFDSFDNPISIVSYSNDGAVLGKRKYEYKFDKNNNWIEQSDFSWKTEKGKANWVLVEIGYRKIKYFVTQ